MKCPCCPDTALLISERQGIEIDYCPQCRGVWLDRGELDKLIERSGEMMKHAAPTRAAPPPPPTYQQPQASHYYGKKHKPSSWLSELFD